MPSILLLHANSSHQVEKQARRTEETAPSAVDEKRSKQDDDSKHHAIDSEATNAEHAERLEKDQIGDDAQGKQDQDNQQIQFPDYQKNSHKFI